MYGAGSWNSPIYISDDEDEATVELELERRLASPRDDFDYNDDWDSYDAAVDTRLWGSARAFEDEYDDLGEDYLTGGAFSGAPSVALSILTTSWRISSGYTPPPPVVVGQKRKRDPDEVPSVIAEPMRPASASAPRTVSPKPPVVFPAESKNARKKRRKRERKEAEAQGQDFAAGPSVPRTSFVHPLPPPPLPLPPMPSVDGITSVKPRMQRLPLLAQVPFALPMRPISHDVLQPPPSKGPMFFTPPAPPPMPHVSRAVPPPPKTPPRVFASLPATYDRSIPPPRLSPEPTLPPPQPFVKRQIGRPPEEDPDGKHGGYTPPNGHRVSHSTTLVMELLPKKFRNLDFLRTWASGFAPKSSKFPRTWINAKAGRGLITFEKHAQAQAAWESPRLSGFGKEHIRVWWYSGPEKRHETSDGSASSSRAEATGGNAIQVKSKAPAVVSTPPPIELEEGEIEEDTAHIRRAKIGRAHV